MNQRLTKGFLVGIAAVAASIAPAAVSHATEAAAPTVCTGLTAGGYDPSQQTTGVRAGSTLTTVNGNLTITAPGRYENLDVHGFVDVRAADVEIRNSRVRGGVATTSRGLITATNAAVRNLVIEGVELVPEHPTLWLTGVLGHDYTARCVDVYQTVDGFGVFNTHDPGGPTRVTIQQSYCHHLAYYSPDPGHDDGHTHNDCVQIQGGSGAVVRQNTLHAYLSGKAGTLNYPADHNQALSAIMLNDNVGRTTQVTVADNLINGGDIAVNAGGLAHQPTDFLGTFHRNRFNRGQYHPGHTIDLDPSVRADTGDGTVNQNRYTDGTPVTVRRNA
jgi:hypothetical protein